MENKRVYDIVTYPVGIEIRDDKLYRFGLKRNGEEPWDYFVDMKIVNYGENNKFGEEIAKFTFEDENNNKLQQRIYDAINYINKCKEYHKIHHEGEMMYQDELISLELILNGQWKDLGENDENT